MNAHNIIKSIRVEIVINMDDSDDLYILKKATEPENLLSPENIKILCMLKERKLNISIKGTTTKKNPIKINTMRRTVDDYIWSLNTVLKTLKSITKGSKNES